MRMQLQDFGSAIPPVLILALVTMALFVAPTRSFPESPGWTLSVRPYDNAFVTGTPARFWVGLTNHSGELQAPCGSHIWYSLQSGQSGTQGGTAKPVTVGECGDPENGQLLLPEETLFRLTTVELPLVADGTLVSVGFTVGGVALCPTDVECDAQPFWASAETTVRVRAEASPN